MFVAHFSVLIALTLVAASAAAASISGVGRAIDGDSLMVGQLEVRLFGVDAPELTQTCTRDGKPWACGSTAAKQLSNLIAGQEVNCVPLGTDKHGRTVARCRVGSTDLNRAMVANGYALAYRRYSMDYISAEESARASRRGIWSGAFELPSTVRRAQDDHDIANAAEDVGEREQPVVSSLGAKPQPTGNCRIKGNHSRKGELIYHLPGMPYYAETVAERIFCTESEARAAGFRRSRADRHR